MLYGLYIEPKYRRKGHATKILEMVIREIRSSGCLECIEIEVDPQENSIDPHNLEMFYIKMGLTIRKEC